MSGNLGTETRKYERGSIVFFYDDDDAYIGFGVDLGHAVVRVHADGNLQPVGEMPKAVTRTLPPPQGKHILEAMAGVAKAFDEGRRRGHNVAVHAYTVPPDAESP